MWRTASRTACLIAVFLFVCVHLSECGLPFSGTRQDAPPCYEEGICDGMVERKSPVPLLRLIPAGGLILGYSQTPLPHTLGSTAVRMRVM